MKKEERRLKALAKSANTSLSVDSTQMWLRAEDRSTP